MPDKIIATPSEDGKRVGYRYMPADYEPAEGEAVVEVPPNPETHVWDDALGGPREKTEAEIADAARQETLERVASEAAESYAAHFINSDDVIGLLASLVKRLVQANPGVTLDPEEADALALLDSGYFQGASIKETVQTTPPEDLGEVHWQGEGG